MLKEYLLKFCMVIVVPVLMTFIMKYILRKIDENMK